MQSMIFFGSDQYSVVVLEALLQSSHDLDLQIVTPNANSSLATYAESHALPLIPYDSFLVNLKSSFINPTSQTDVIGLSASFPRLFPPEVIKKFSSQLYNLHPSLLPQYRNVAPIPYAIAMGDPITGITLQRIDAQIDHGEIISQIEEPILPTDTTPILLNRLFSLGSGLFLRWLTDQQVNLPTGQLSSHSTDPLIFTRRLTRDSGYVEWAVVKQLVSGGKIAVKDTANPLIKLRLTHYPNRTDNILPDLIRALEGYEKVWTIATTRKGKIEISITYDLHNTIYKILIPGRPRPIPYSDFEQYYLT